MNYFYTFLLCLSISLCSFSQVITFECNNEIIVVSLEEVSDNPNALIDWNGDGVVDESDYVIYFQQIYNCYTGCMDDDIVTAVVDCAPCSEDQTMIFWEEFDEEDCTLWQMCGCENNDTEWNDIDWVLSDWEDFDWGGVWDEFDLGNAIDWNNIPWDDIIDLNLIPDDLLDYLISMVSSGQPFNWDSFLSTQSCNDDDNAVSIGLSIWTDVSGCSDALIYINSLGYNCFTELNMPFVSYEDVTLYELCCETCENANGGGGDDIEGCTDNIACNYNSDATVDDGSCLLDNDAAVAAELGLLGINDCASLLGYVMSPDTYGYTLEEACAWDGTGSPLGSFGYTIGSVCECSCVPVLGCTNPGADNYDSSANTDDGSCIIPGCTDSTACNYNPEATVDDGSCEDGVVECLVSPCSVSENPGVPGAYCVDDYCEGCCALWYTSEDAFISNSCDNIDDEQSIFGIWYDAESNQYFEITEDVFAVYFFLEEEDDYGGMGNCWFYWAMDYIDLGGGLLEITDTYGEVTIISTGFSDSGDLEFIIPDDEYEGGYPFVLESVDFLPELDMCGGVADNEGCEDIYGQWTYANFSFIIIDEYGIKIMYPVEDDFLCYEVLFLSYSQDENSDVCQIFIEGYGMQFEFGQAFLNDDGTLSFIIEEDDSDFPEIWTSDNSDLSGIETCISGCTDSEACNYDPFATSDDGTCGLIDDCGDCQVPYCYDMATSSVEYISEEECEGLWVGNDCEEDPICLSNPMNPYWNANCNTFIEENIIINNPKSIINVLGQGVRYDKSSLKIYLHKDGSFEKKYIVK